MALAKCAHVGCACLPTPGMNYCSTRCENIEEFGEHEDIGCSCGHRGCDPRGIELEQSSFAPPVEPPVGVR